MPPRERERDRSRRRRGPRGGDPNRPSQLSRRERGLPTEDRGREPHRDRGVEHRRVEPIVDVVELAARAATAASGGLVGDVVTEQVTEKFTRRGPLASRGFRLPTSLRRGRPGVHRRGHRARQRKRAITLSVIEKRDRDPERVESGVNCGSGYLRARSVTRTRVTTSLKRRWNLRESLSIL